MTPPLPSKMPKTPAPMTTLPLPISLLLTLCALAACGRSEAPAAARPSPPAEPAHAVPTARISAQAAQNVGIVLARAAPAPIAEVLPLYGAVQANAERVRKVSARFPGTLRTVTKAVGDAVRAGETLATVESNESLQTYAITAPIAGIVSARNANPGEQAGAEPLFTIADLSTVWISLSLFPADAARVHIGQSVRVESVDGGVRASGRIAVIGVFGDSGAQSLSARVPLANAERRWTPGLFVSGAVELSTRDAAVAIAAGAVQQLDGREVVFVPVPGGFAPRAVTLGRRDEAHAEVLEGLKAGDEYVAANSFIVKAELGKAALEEDDDQKDSAKPVDDDAKPKQDADDAPEPRR